MDRLAGIYRFISMIATVILPWTIIDIFRVDPCPWWLSGLATMAVVALFAWAVQVENRRLNTNEDYRGRIRWFKTTKNAAEYDLNRQEKLIKQYKDRIDQLLDEI